jgi:hypothetical protein
MPGPWLVRLNLASSALTLRTCGVPAVDQPWTKHREIAVRVKSSIKLRIVPDDGSDTFKSMQRGVMAFAQGCFAAIRDRRRKMSRTRSLADVRSYFSTPSSVATTGATSTRRTPWFVPARPQSLRALLGWTALGLALHIGL